MRFPRKSLRLSGVERARRAFTLAEVLAALAFMAIVIPVAVEGIRVASQAGQLGQRKTVAMRIADRVLTEAVLSSQVQSATSSGTVEESGLDYRWSMQTTSWSEDTMRLVTVTVYFQVQGDERSVKLSTLTGTSSL